MAARNELTLKRKIEVNDYIRKNPSTAAEKSPWFSTVSVRKFKPSPACAGISKGRRGGEFSDISETLAAEQGGSSPLQYFWLWGDRAPQN